MEELFEDKGYCGYNNIISSSPRITEDDAAYVSIAALICEQFQVLYLDWSIMPKMHFCVHMPRLMFE